VCRARHPIQNRQPQTGWPSSGLALVIRRGARCVDRSSLLGCGGAPLGKRLIACRPVRGRDLANDDADTSRRCTQRRDRSEMDLVHEVPQLLSSAAFHKGHFDERHP